MLYGCRLSDWAIRYPNVVVMRTLSKVGLAGSRFGMLIGHPDWIVEFDKIRLPYNINVLTQTVVQFALERAPTLEEQSGKIRQERRRLTTLLEERGFSVWPSEANFVVVDCETHSARSLFEGLKQYRIGLDGRPHTRLTVGAPEESMAFGFPDQLVSSE